MRNQADSVKLNLALGEGSQPSVPAPQELSRQGFAFIGIGAMSALTYVMVCKWLLGLTLPFADWAVSGALYALFVPLVYLAHHTLSFRSVQPHMVALPRYVCVQVLASCIAALTSFLVLGVFGLAHGLGSLIVICASSAFSFVALKAWAFASKEQGI